MGEGDASPTGPYQSERGEAKSTTIDATGHTVYNEDGARFTFPSFHLSVSPPLYSAEVSKIFRSLLNSNRYRSFRDICIRLSNLDERSNLVKLSRNERVGRRGRVELSKYRNENSEGEESVRALKRASYSTGLLICIATYTPRVTSSVCRELWQPFYAFSRIRTNRAINYQLVQEQQRPKEKLATLKPHALSIVP